MLLTGDSFNSGRCWLQVDLIDFSGPLYKDVDNRFAALRLVQKRFCDAALFNPQGAWVFGQPCLAFIVQPDAS